MAGVCLTWTKSVMLLWSRLAREIRQWLPGRETVWSLQLEPVLWASLPFCMACCGRIAADRVYHTTQTHFSWLRALTVIGRGLADAFELALPL